MRSGVKEGIFPRFFGEVKSGKKREGSQVSKEKKTEKFFGERKIKRMSVINLEEIDIFMVDEFDLLCALEGVVVKQEYFDDPEEEDRDKRAKARRRYFAMQKETRKEREDRLWELVIKELARRAGEEGMNVVEETVGDKRAREGSGSGGSRRKRRVKKDPRNKDRPMWVVEEDEGNTSE